MTEIKMINFTGSFAENKDIARDIRINRIIPALESKKEVVIDFIGINAATQSFVHALISDLISKRGVEVLDKIYFKNCSETVKKMISIVAEYIQESE